MVNETNLRDTLLSFATENRKTFIMMSSMLNELVALRETVRGLDPTFADIMEHRRQEAERNGAQIAENILSGYDLIIQKLNDGHVC